jgi:hypothetical protein
MERMNTKPEREFVELIATAQVRVLDSTCRFASSNSPFNKSVLASIALKSYMFLDCLVQPIASHTSILQVAGAAVGPSRVHRNLHQSCMQGARSHSVCALLRLRRIRSVYNIFYAFASVKTFTKGITLFSYPFQTTELYWCYA